jgi:hypothetical protein
MQWQLPVGPFFWQATSGRSAQDGQLLDGREGIGRVGA